MREFAIVEPASANFLVHGMTTFYMGGQTIAFVNSVCRLDDPSPVQLAWLDEQIKDKLIVETTPKKKIKPSQRTAKKKGG